MYKYIYIFIFFLFLIIYERPEWKPLSPRAHAHQAHAHRAPGRINLCLLQTCLYQSPLGLKREPPHRTRCRQEELAAWRIGGAHGAALATRGCRRSVSTAGKTPQGVLQSRRQAKPSRRKNATLPRHRLARLLPRNGARPRIPSRHLQRTQATPRTLG